MIYKIVDSNNPTAGFNLDTNASYRDCLISNLRSLEEFTNANSLSYATQLINVALEPQGFHVSEREVDTALFGERGMITSIKESLSDSGNRFNPHRHSAPLRKHVQYQGVWLDQDNNPVIRGLLVEGANPQPVKSGSYSRIRRVVTEQLGLKVYIRHKLLVSEEFFQA